MKNAKGILGLEIGPLQKFLHTVGGGIERYFGKDPACVVYLRPDGAFYALGIFEWMTKKKKNIKITGMADDGSDLEKDKVKGRKVLVVDGDIVSGKAYKRSMEALRLQKEALKIKDIKFACYVDRAGLADFSVWHYTAEAAWHPADIDAADLKIVSFLRENGRMPFAEIGKRLKMSGVAVKNRVEWLQKRGVLEVRGALHMDKFYSLSAVIQIDAGQRAMTKLIDKLETMPEVYHLVKRVGSYNLAVGILVQDLESVNNFVDKHVRPIEGIRSIAVHLGELPIVPKTFLPRHSP